MVEVVKSYDPLLEEGEFAAQNEEANRRADEYVTKMRDRMSNIGGNRFHAKVIVGGKVGRFSGIGELTIDISFCDSQIEQEVNVAIFASK